MGNAGARRPPSSSPWPRHARCQFLKFNKVGLRRHGSAGGVPSSLAARPVHFPCPCWTNTHVRDDRFSQGRPLFFYQVILLPLRFRCVWSCTDYCFWMPASSLFRVKKKKKAGLGQKWCGPKVAWTKSGMGQKWCGSKVVRVKWSGQKWSLSESAIESSCRVLTIQK